MPDMTNHHDQHQPTHVVIVGLPFCGKTRVGQLLARQLRRPFFDSDTAVSLEAHHAGTGTTDHEELLAHERAWFDNMLGITTPSVVAAPASLLDRDADWKRDDIWVVWIDPPIEVVAERLRSVDDGDTTDTEARVTAVRNAAPRRRGRAADIADLHVPVTDEDATTLTDRVVHGFTEKFPAPPAGS